MARPYWSGQIRLALVFLPVNLYTATRRSASVPLHEYQRSTGQRIHHRDTNEEGEEVAADEIVKGYEPTKGHPVFLEKDELDAVKLPSSDTLDLKHFVPASSLPPPYLERPYYVLPDGDSAQEIYAVLHEALQASGTVGIGQIALRGREELCAVMPAKEGLMLQTLRYQAELLDAKDFYSGVKAVQPSEEYVALARQLIKRNTGRLNLGQFHDHYHEALQELIDAKRQHRAPEYQVAEKPAGKVIDLMGALKASLGDAGGTKKKPATKSKAKPARKTTPARKPARRRSA